MRTSQGLRVFSLLAITVSAAIDFSNNVKGDIVQSDAPHPMITPGPSLAKRQEQWRPDSVTITTNDAGDTVIEMDAAMRQFLEGETDVDQCAAPGQRVKRNECLNVVADNLMNGLNVELVDWLVVLNIPRFRENLLRDVARVFFDAGRAVSNLNAISDDLIWNVAYVFAYIFEETVIRGSQDIADPITIPASSLQGSSDSDEATSTSSSDSECPTDESSPACPDDNCRGGSQPSPEVCADDSEYSGCSCAPVVTPIAHPVDRDWLNRQQEGLQHLLDGWNESGPEGDQDEDEPEPEWTESWTPGTCGFHLTHDYPTMFMAGGKSKVAINRVWDGAGNTIGDEPAYPQTTVGDNQLIHVRTPLPLPIDITVRKWGDNGIWRYRKSFEFKYNNTLWRLNNEWDDPAGRCDLDGRPKSAAENNNRYEGRYNCVFPCIYSRDGVRAPGT